jgi:SAM-dependent methyltransferase
MMRPVPARSATSGQTGAVVANINYGTGIPDDAELRLCGDLSGGKRALELGVSNWFNSVDFAIAGAKSIAVDSDPDRIAEVRRRATEAEVQVQCHETALADLGDVASGSCDVVAAVHTIDEVDDLGRLLRQVHRVLIPSRPFVISLPHPYASITPEHPYGSQTRSIGNWFTALSRSNFNVDQLLELGVGPSHPAPKTLIIRALKEGS